MIIQCPQCQTRYSLEEKQLRHHTDQQIRCRKCQAEFPVQLSGGGGPMAGKPAVIHRNEFNKRLRSVGSSVSLEATILRSGARPWLDQDKVVSLVVIDGPMKGKVFPITKPRVSLGRYETDIVLEDSEISRTHCALEVRGGSALLVDLGSTNGTFVDDQRIETQELEHMSEFRLGSTVVMFSARAKD